MPVTYPIRATDTEKLHAVYRLVEEARLAHNVEGAKADSKEKWAKYSVDFKARMNLLLGERARLRKVVRKATYTDEKWNALDSDARMAVEETMYGNIHSAKLTPTLARSTDLDAIKALSVDASPALEIDDPTEDLTTYTQVDPNSHIATTTDRCTFAGLIRNETAYCYKDHGVNHFAGDFEHLVIARATSMANTAECWIWGLANELNDFNSASAARMGITWYDDAYRLYLIDFDPGATQDYFAGAVDTTYYLKIVRDEAVGANGTAYCYIYSDATMETLVDTLSVALDNKNDFRYLYCCSSYNTGHATAGSGWAEDFDLQEAAAPARRIFITQT